MIRCASLTVILLVTVLTASCRPLPRISLFNNTGKAISVEADGQLLNLRAGTAYCGRFPGNTMSMTIKCGENKWRYQLRYPPSEYCGPIGEEMVRVQVETDGRVFVLLVGESLPAKSFSSQPAGFPLLPLGNQEHPNSPESRPSP